MQRRGLLGGYTAFSAKLLIRADIQLGHVELRVHRSIWKGKIVCRACPIAGAGAAPPLRLAIKLQDLEIMPGSGWAMVKRHLMCSVPSVRVHSSERGLQLFMASLREDWLNLVHWRRQLRETELSGGLRTMFQH